MVDDYSYVESGEQRYVDYGGFVIDLSKYKNSIYSKKKDEID